MRGSSNCQKVTHNQTVHQWGHESMGAESPIFMKSDDRFNDSDPIDSNDSDPIDS